MPLATGQVLNQRYRIVKLLGQGGFGAVYRAWDLNLRSPCAVKESLDTSPEAQRQFRQEALMLSALRHPGLPNVIDSFSIEGQGQYMVMEFIEGEDLQEKLDRAGGRLPEAQVLPWIAQVCDALIYMHGQNPPIIHRDIKPANIRIRPDGRAMLVDFGIAKVYDPHLRTTVGARAVTPGYSPLEQYGQGRTDARTDVYALGATLYHLLTGQEPQESIQRATGDQLVPPERLNPALSRPVAAALQRSLQLQPDQRFQNVAAFKQALTAPAPASRPWPAATVQMGGSSGLSGSARPAAVPRSSPAQPLAGLQIPAWGWVALVLGGLVLMIVIFNGLKGSAAPTAAPPPPDEPTAAYWTDTPLPDEPTTTPTRVNLSATQRAATATRQPAAAVPTATSRPPTATSLPTATPTATPAPPQVLYLRPSCGKSFTVQSGRPIRLVYGLWGVKGADLLRDTMPYIKVKLAVNGNRMTGDLQSNLLSMSEVPCGTKLDGAYWLNYIIDIGTYPPGSYSIQVDFSFTTEITDGYDLNNDGRLDAYGPSTPIQQKYTLVVK